MMCQTKFSADERKQTQQKRMLTMRELARAQGFPDDFEFHGSIDEVNRQVGTAFFSTKYMV